jgi:diguanylate cyclase (GGDEF)-like protein
MTLRVLLILLTCIAIQGYLVALLNTPFSSMGGVNIVLSLVMITVLIRQYYSHEQYKNSAKVEALNKEKQTKDSQQQLLNAQQDAQEQLEVSVQERTLELNIALQELEEANRELEKKNTLDELSGLHNRRFYDKKITAEYRRSKRNLTPLSLVLIDIDHFKRVNDDYGHQAGDQCITWIAQQIKQCLKRPSDICCRYGGEEFCLILPETTAQGAKALAEIVRAQISDQAFSYKNDLLAITISCGVSTYEQQANVVQDDIFSAADKSLYFAKKNGRDQVHQHIFIDSTNAIAS